MKNFKFLLVLMMLVSTVAFAQKPYNPVTLDIGIGNHAVNDPSYTTNTSMHLNSHWNFGLRYNFNPTVGLGLRFGWDNMYGFSEYGYSTELLDFIEPMSADIAYKRLSIEATIDILDVLDVYNDVFTMLIHGGIGGARAVSSIQDYEQTMGMFTGGFTGVFKIHNNLGIKVDYSISSHIDQARTLDGVFPAGAEGMTSNVHNGSVGIMMWFGPNDKKPADFYVKPKLVPIVQSDTTIVNNHQHLTQVTKIIKEEFKETFQEFVFFDHDKDKVRKSELNAIYQIYTTLKEDDKRKVYIIGWASDTSSSVAYNQALAERRCEAIKLKFMDMGIDASRLTLEPNGKDFHLGKENVHDVARRVELLIYE